MYRPAAQKTKKITIPCPTSNARPPTSPRWQQHSFVLVVNNHHDAFVLVSDQIRRSLCTSPPSLSGNSSFLDFSSLADIFVAPSSGPMYEIPQQRPFLLQQQSRDSPR